MVYHSLRILFCSTKWRLKKCIIRFFFLDEIEEATLDLKANRVVYQLKIKGSHADLLSFSGKTGGRVSEAHGGTIDLADALYLHLDCAQLGAWPTLVSFSATL